MKKRLTDLKHLKLYTESGIYLGRLFELRSLGIPEHGDRRTERKIDQIVYGKLGLLERLGLKQSAADTIPWDSVTAMDEEKIVVGSNFEASRNM